MDEKELQAIRARAEHTPPLRPARLKEIETLAAHGVPLARDCMHMVRAWQASQAEKNAEQPGDIPVAVVKRLGGRDDNALVVMRLETFREFFVNREA
jgi:hypothetical protein